MPTKNFIKTEAKIFLDGKEVTNFFTDGVRVIGTDEAQSVEVLKLYDAFSGTITLSYKQSKRFIKQMNKALRKNRWKQIKDKIFRKVKK